MTVSDGRIIEANKVPEIKDMLKKTNSDFKINPFN